MLRFAAAFALIAAAAPAVAQPPAAPAVTQAAAEIDAAADALGNCIGTNAERADADQTPEVAAAAVLATCTPHKRRLEDVVEAMIVTLPLARQGPARERLRTSLNSAEAQIAAGIRAQRAGAAAAPAAVGSTPN